MKALTKIEVMGVVTNLKVGKSFNFGPVDLKFFVQNGDQNFNVWKVCISSIFGNHRGSSALAYDLIGLGSYYGHLDTLNMNIGTLFDIP